MAKPSTGRFVPIAVASLVAATSALAGSTDASAALPTYSNGLIAYTCIGYNNVSNADGWVTKVPVVGGASNFYAWDAPLGNGWGPYYGGVNWSADGSEMVHDAAFSASALGGRDTMHTVFLSEADADYPWEDTNYFNSDDAVDTDTTFTPDGRDILFTRTAASAQKIEVLAAGGELTPTELPQPAGDNREPTASVNGDIAFVNVAGSGANAGVPWVWLLPSGSDTPVALQAGENPAFSPDGSLIAFVSNDRTTVSTMTTAGASVTPAGPSTFPGTIKDFAWSPDGTSFVFGLAVGTGVLRTAPVTAGSALTSVQYAGCKTSVADQVSWQGVPTGTSRDQVVRLWGATRHDTSVAVSHAGFAAAGSADAVVLADSFNFPDALSGAPLAAFVHGPLLLTQGSASTVVPSVLAEISRVLGSTTKPIYILGGTFSVSASIQNQLALLGYSNIVRYAGTDRYDTSLQVANAMGHDATAPHEILLATGTNFPDGLSAGAAAASYWPGSGGGVVLLTKGGTLTAGVKSYIDNAIADEDPANPVYVTTVGGLAGAAYPQALHPDVITCTGLDRYETSACVAEVHFGAQPVVTVATGLSFPDALSGGALAGSLNAPLLLTPPTLVANYNEVPYYLHATSGAISTAFIFGGTLVVNATQQSQLQAVIGLGTTYAQNPTGVLAAAARGTAKSGIKTTPVVKGPPSRPHRTH